MPYRRNRALHDENICASFLRNPAKFRGALRNRTDRGYNSGIFNLTNTRSNEILLNRFLVDALEQRRNLGLARFDDFLQNFLRVLVASLHSFKVQNGEPAELIHCDREAHVDNAIHGAGEDRNLKFERLRLFAWQTERDVHFVRVDRYAPRHERNLVETIRHPRFAISAYPHSHVKYSPS